ncbi:hypothetical protein LPH54_08035 [Xylella taiwanensis]|uniref:hypothetical protein n=1 Tax=Xylella taiwanensis TaxID=1444770 RepID=UPI001E30F03E|nr:hypothetical protein [Xylella taiwanensis]UFS48943.1 hypothetical protein LPH54_08035 [Xylella taiwanensis]
MLWLVVQDWLHLLGQVVLAVILDQRRPMQHLVHYQWLTGYVVQSPGSGAGVCLMVDTCHGSASWGAHGGESTDVERCVQVMRELLYAVTQWPVHVISPV